MSRLALLFTICLSSLAFVGCAEGRKPTVELHDLMADRRIPPASATSAAKPSVPLELRVGTSGRNRPILSYRFDGPTRDSSANRVVLLFAGIHGDEPTSVYAAERLIELLNHDPSAVIPAGLSVLIVPVANPDGYAAKTRQNAAHVDLNRNFPAANWKPTPHGDYWNGPAPLSEPESRALRDLVLREKPIRILALHAIRPPHHGNNYDGPARGLAELLAAHNHYNVLPTIGYPTPGSFGSWAGIDLQIPTITLEFPSNSTGLKAWQDNRDALLAFIRGG